MPIYDAGHWTLAIICNPPSNVFPRPPTMLLHLDSLSMMPVHQSPQVFEALRTYLQAEWDASARSSTFEQGLFSVPWQYEKKYCQLPPDFQRCDCSSSLQCVGFALVHHEMKPLPPSSSPPAHSTGAESIVLEVPQQPESSNDCALFIVAFTEFFIYAQLNNKTPGFLTPSWFFPDNAGLMREHIRWG